MERPQFVAVFGQVVRRERERLGLTQEGLAEAAGIHRTHVSFIERGVHGASLQVALKLADAFGITLTALVSKAERKWRKR